MSINASFLGLVILVSALLFGSLSYYLGKRKTETPVLTTLVGILLSLVPLLGLIYVVILVLKRDIPSPVKASINP